jgi:proteasome lid subunit RPN8/RPN11
VLDVRQIADNDLETARAPAVRQELRIFFTEAAFDRAVTRGDNDTTREIGGVLVGQLLRDDGGPFLRVDATIDALHAEEKGAELTFTHATWEHIHKEMDSTYDGKKIVGWYHTHPGFGIFLSDRDQFICQSFFDLPFQVALVYDPKSKEHGVFSWRDGQPSRCRRYWVGEREHTWDGTRAPAPASAEEPSPKSASAPSAVKTALALPTVVRVGRDAVEPARGAGAAEAKAGDERASAFDLKITIGTTVLALVLGGLGGFRWGTTEERRVLEQLEVELSRVRGEAERHVKSEIDLQLIGLLRGTIGNDAVRRPLETTAADLEQAEKLLEDAPAPGTPEFESGLARLRSARDRVRRVRDDRGDAQAALAQLEEIARQGALGPAEVSRDLGTLRVGLGALYAELAADAARAKDGARAERLLAAAVAVDPANQTRYAQQVLGVPVVLHPQAPGPAGPAGVRPAGPGAAPIGPPPPPNAGGPIAPERGGR